MRDRPVFIDGVPEFKPGDPRPEGYAEISEWADVQLKAGIKQSQCSICKLWHFPQENHKHEFSVGEAMALADRYASESSRNNEFDNRNAVSAARESLRQLIIGIIQKKG